MYFIFPKWGMIFYYLSILDPTEAGFEAENTSVAR